VGSGLQRTLFANFHYRDGDFYDGHRTTVSGDGTWKPSPRFNLTLRYDWNDIELTGIMSP